MNLFYHPEIVSGINVLSSEDSRHATKVLRLKPGEVIELTDGKGTLYEAQIRSIDFKGCKFEITKRIPQPRRPYHIHIAIAPTKNMDRTEWFVEKAVELGVDQITFLLCRNSGRKTINTDRLQKLVISAIKQSRQAWMPELNPMMPLKDILSSKAALKFIAHVDPNQPNHLKNLARPKGDYLVMIGPEGDFTPEEIRSATEAGFEKVSLGTSRLRTETAGLAACHTLHLVNV